MRCSQASRVILLSVVVVVAAAALDNNILVAECEAVVAAVVGVGHKVIRGSQLINGSGKVVSLLTTLSIALPSAAPL
jgi:hypothetical protein